mgnify:CR=1 FL=1
MKLKCIITAFSILLGFAATGLMAMNDVLSSDAVAPDQALVEQPEDMARNA